MNSMKSHSGWHFCRVLVFEFRFVFLFTMCCRCCSVSLDSSLSESNIADCRIIDIHRLSCRWESIPNAASDILQSNIFICFHIPQLLRNDLSLCVRCERCERCTIERMPFLSHWARAVRVFPIVLIYWWASIKCQRTKKKRKMCTFPLFTSTSSRSLAPTPHPGRTSESNIVFQCKAIHWFRRCDLLDVELKYHSSSRIAPFRVRTAYAVTGHHGITAAIYEN